MNKLLITIVLILAVQLGIFNTAGAQEVEKKSIRELVDYFEIVSAWRDREGVSEEIVFVFVRGGEVHKCMLFPVANRNPDIMYEGRGEWNLVCRPLGGSTNSPRPVGDE